MDHEKWMKLALEQAYQAIGLTSPNPCVGAVIVKQGKLLAKGYHLKAGQLHAEREAIKEALVHHCLEDLKEATIYVTLEPCSTQGTTSACTDALIEYQFREVVYGSSDPNPHHLGAAKKLLEAQGIKVTSGVLKEECDRLIRPFRKQMTKGLPWVIAKTAMSLDGRISRPKGESQWLSCEQSRVQAHRLRARVDAIIVGGRTVRKDNPSLTIRLPDLSSHKKQPLRVVLTHEGRESLPEKSAVFTDSFREYTKVYHQWELESVLKDLCSLGCQSVLLELSLIHI